MTSKTTKTAPAAKRKSPAQKARETRARAAKEKAAWLPACLPASSKRADSQRNEIS